MVMRETCQAYIESMDKYIEELKELNRENPEQAREKATQNLIDSGIFNAEGKLKKQICK